jgi:hypothetical protein
MSANPFDEAYDATKEKPKPAAKPAATARAVPEREEGGDLVKVTEPGEYDLDDDSYHADPCPEPSLSSSLAKVLISRSPRHAWEKHPRLNPAYEPVEKTMFDLGSAFHKLILGQGRELEVCDYPDWRTNAAKAERDAARAAHRIPILEHQYERALAMESAVRRQIRRHEELLFAMAGGVAERALIWQEITAFGPVWCRIKLDWKPHAGVLFPDWKSTEGGAGPDEWGGKTMWNMDSDIQAAFYERGIKAVLGIDAVVFFAVAETYAPHALATHRVTPAAAGMANRLVEEAIQVWGLCLNRKRWPGYPTQMSWQDPPAWKERPRLEREERGDTPLPLAQMLIDALGESDRPADRIGDDSVDAFGLAPLQED